MIAIQLWAALRFVSFVMLLVVGIGGTLVAMAIAMSRTEQAGWFPWVLPPKMLSAPNPVSYAMFGGIGGFILLIIMIADLSRHDSR